jgi:hypothetical protein
LDCLGVHEDVMYVFGDVGDRPVLNSFVCCRCRVVVSFVEFLVTEYVLHMQDVVYPSPATTAIGYIKPKFNKNMHI